MYSPWTPEWVCTKLVLDWVVLYFDSGVYIMLVGKLKYLTVAKPEMISVVTIVSQFLNFFSQGHNHTNSKVC